MNKAKYFQLGEDNIKRLKNGVVTYFGNNTIGRWAPSHYTASEVVTYPIKRISRDKAREQFPKAFRKGA